MDKIIVLKDKYNNIYGVDNNICIGSISIDNKLQKCCICIDGSTIPSIYNEVKLFSIKEIQYYKNIFRRKFENSSIIEIHLNNSYLENNQKVVGNMILVNIENLYNTNITYDIILLC